MKTTLALAVAMLTVAGAARAQVVESIEVRVTNVEVVVTGPDGKPVHGLTRDDFELLEDGKPQPITNFYEVRAATAIQPDEAATDSVVPEESRRRRIIVFIDNTTLHPLRRNEVLTSVRDSLSTLLRPGDDVMVAAWERRLKVLQPFTTDSAAVRSVLQAATSSSAGAPLLFSEKSRVVARANELLGLAQSPTGRRVMTVQDAYREAIVGARNYSESFYLSTKGLLGGLRQMISTLSGLEGRKVLIFVGGELQQTPGVDAVEAVNAIFGAAGVNVGVATLTESGRNLRPELEKVVNAAAGSGVSFYMVDAGDRSGFSDASVSEQQDPLATFLGNSETMLTMSQLANATGGRALSGTRNYRAVLDGMASDLSSYYSLGYRADTASAVRKLRVRSKRPGITVRSRSIVQHRNAHEQMQDRVVTNAFHADLGSDFDVSIAMGTRQPEGRNLRVPITVSFPSDLIYLPEGDSLVGEFAVYIVVAGLDGNLSPVASDIRPVKFTKSQLATLGQKPFEYTTTLVVRNSEQTLSVAVVDRVGERVGYATARFAGTSGKSAGS
ncbi:MAG: VWA domain-containing protein [Thermoanaerobaculia bacterium]